MSALLLKFKANYLQKMRGYPQFSLWIPIALAKMYFFRVVLTWRKNLCIQQTPSLSPVGKMYIVCALLRNAHNCLYQSSTSKFFGIDPPQIQDYFNQVSEDKCNTLRPKFMTFGYNSIQLLVRNSLLTRLQNVTSPISDHFIVAVHLSY